MHQLLLQDYTIHIGSYWNELENIINSNTYTKIFVLVDENTKKYCLPILHQALPSHKLNIIEIASGESNKTLDTCQFIWEVLMRAQADRNSLLLNLGGGVIGDMGGFCASTFKRGMDFIQIPSTLLSQVDASIGGKLGIDFSKIKNSIGLFKNPKAVLINVHFLKTLPLEELRSGYAEILKHSLIASKDQWEHLSTIENLRTYTDWNELVLPSLNIKQMIVEEDPFEKGIRKALNFGHTIGHAIESWALESERVLLHGEAIAIGMICESYLSYKLGHLSEKDLKSISTYIASIYDKYDLKKSIYPTLINLMRNDKKNINQAINFTLLNGIGACIINQTCSDDLIVESLKFYQDLKLSN